MTKLLIVDDEQDITKMLNDYFTYKNYNVITANSGEEALKKITLNPDIILLDINMPDINGIDICKRIREFVNCPILFLTAKIEDADKLLGFRVGGDDYIVKPFKLDILAARIEAHLRRQSRNLHQNRLSFWDDLIIDYSAKKVFLFKEEVSFPKKEFEIIELLSSHPGQIFDKERIFELLWEYDSDSNPSVIAEHIRRIRKRIATKTDKQYIDTIWGIGYRWI